MTTLDKNNTKVFKSEKGNLYLSHPSFKQHIRFYAYEAELGADPEWRVRISLREGTDNSFYAVLAKSALEEMSY